MAKKKKRLDLTMREIRKLAKKGEDVWVVYRYGQLRQLPATLFAGSEWGERIFFTNYWLAFAASQQRKADYNLYDN